MLRSIAKAFFLRWCHCIRPSLLLRGDHRFVTRWTGTRLSLLFGWRPVAVECECGRVFYRDETERSATWKPGGW